jgi:hypothetical protein
MTAPSVQAAEIERHARLPAGAGERFTGYGVMGLPFASGHVLAMRRFPASSIGPAYTSVWHRDPAGRWDFWQNQPGDQACSRFTWRMTMAASAATRVLNTIGALLPDRVWRAPPVLALMGPAAGMALRAGRVAMAGRAPNGQAFVANPKWIWLIAKSSAQLDGQQFGPPGPLGQQARLGDLWIPQRGVFAIGRAFFSHSPAQPARPDHGAARTR